MKMHRDLPHITSLSVTYMTRSWISKDKDWLENGKYRCYCSRLWLNQITLLSEWHWLPVLVGEIIGPLCYTRKQDYLQAFGTYDRCSGWSVFQPQSVSAPATAIQALYLQSLHQQTCSNSRPSLLLRHQSEDLLDLPPQPRSTNSSLIEEIKALLY